jgi:hypothetical protein
MRIALDPWGSDYGSQIAIPYEVDSEETSVQALGKQIEECPWEPIVPSSATLPEVTAVIDGVMRVDAPPAVIIDGEKRFPALFCSYAAGAVVLNQKVEIVEEQVGRLFIVGSSQSGPDIEVPAGNSNKGPLLYRSVSSQATTPDKLRQTLMTEMRQSEAEVAGRLSSPEKLILADGNLTFIGGSSSVVGVIKTIQRIYLSPTDAAILERLRPGERTPLFHFPGSSTRKSYEVLTCYLRLVSPRPIEHSFAGLVRIEVDYGLGVQKAVALLEQAAVKVFALASHAPKDPRAPQNLIPVGGLERQLRRKLGDPQLIRRGIEKALRAML